MHTEIGSLDGTIVHRFLGHRKNLGCTRHGDAAALDRFLHMLRGQGVAPPKKQSPLSPRQQLIANYERYLFQKRGLARGTVIYYVAMVDEFLSTRFRQRPLDLSQLGAPDVTGFVRQRAHKLGPRCAQLLVTALRSFLRYLQHQGKVRADLAVCVPSVARWSFAALPKFLPACSVRKCCSAIRGGLPSEAGITRFCFSWPSSVCVLVQSWP
jgi:hypothetical protein